MTVLGQVGLGYWGPNLLRNFRSLPGATVRAACDLDPASLIYYPVSLHRQEIYEHLGLGSAAYPQAGKAAHEVLALPIYPELTVEQVTEVAGAIGRFFGA